MISNRYHYHYLAFLCLAILIPFFASSQTGDFILSHHAPKHSEIDNVNFEIISDNNGVICIANRFGVLKYDGQVWDFYKTNSSALSLTASDDNTIYVGCLSEFGKLDYVNNSYQYVPLITTDSLDDHFLQTFSIGDHIYFLSDVSLFRYTPSTEQVTKLLRGDFLNGYVHGQELHINSYDDHLIKVTKNKIDSIAKPEKMWGLISNSPTGEYQYGVDLSGGLYWLKDGELQRHFQYDRLREAGIIITDLVWVTDTLIACSTMESGVIFLHSNDPDYFEITDYHSGLPDNEIHDIYADNNGGVWVSHEFGLTRIAPLFPAYSYTNFPGLEGNLIEAQRIHGDLWVNTSLGVYYFSQDTSYRRRVYVQTIKKSRPAAKAQSADNVEEKQEQEEIEQEEEQKGFLSGLFKKKNRAKETQEREEEKKFLQKIFSSEDDEKQSETASPTKQDKDKYEYVRRVEKIVTGITYQFHHVPGTDGKFRQLIETRDKILATSHSGIYEITKNSAQLVINEPIQYAYVVPNSNRLLISTEYGMLKYYQLEDNVWIELSNMYFNDHILNVYIDQHDDVWLAGTTHIYQGRFGKNTFGIQHSYEINNRFYDELSIWEHSNTLYFINSQGYFRLDRKSDHIVKDLELEKELGEPHHHLHNEKSRVWLYNGKIWSLLSPDGSVTEFHYLGVFPNLKYINYDEVLHRYWLVTEDNQLLAYEISQIPELNESYSLFIKRLISQNGEIRVRHNIQLAHNQNTLSIELLKPDFLGLLNPEYQYKLLGLNEEWSNWTHANLIDYSYLPPGSYELIVRVRDALGQLEETNLLELTVETPYWQQPWFYAIQAVILALIIGITSRLDERKSYNRIIKHGLSILTLIVIIEFLQSVLSAYLEIESTPVIDFLIDAGIAIMVFPLEWVLRKLILDGGLKISGTSKKTTL